MQEISRRAGELGLSYEAEVVSFSTSDFFFSYSVRLYTYFVFVCIVH